jgi:hypothetical protein
VKEEVAAMTAVNCPMCELRFATRTERDWHLRNEHQHAHVHGPTNRPVPWTRHPVPDFGPWPDPQPAATEEEQR